MGVIRAIFGAFGAVLKFINNHFKAMIFLLILVLIFGGKDNGEPNLARIDLVGEIADSELVLEQIYTAMDDENIKGVLLYIDSPGGALAPSVELFEAINRLKTHKKVLAYAAGAMTSGSYYAGVAADKIIANKGAFIGSIGVIMQGANLSELARKIGISEQVVKAGEFKEAGTILRKWSDAERTALQGLVDKSYEMFVADIATARNLDTNKSKIWGNARVFLASEAVNLGLIDSVGDLYLARQEIATMSGVKKAIWQEKPFFEKFINKQMKNGVQSLVNAVFGVRIY